MKTFKKFSAWSPVSLPIRVWPLGQSDSRFLIFWRILQHAATFWKRPNYKWSKNDSIWFCHVPNSFACLPLLPCPPDDITVFFNGFNSCYMSRVYSLFPAVGRAMRQWKGLVKSSMNQLYGHDDVTTVLDCHVVVSFLIIFFSQILLFFLFYFCILLCCSDSTTEKIIVSGFESDQSQISTLFPVIFFQYILFFPISSNAVLSLSKKKN